MKTRIVSVDIQPEYLEGIRFDLNSWCEYINRSARTMPVTFFFNDKICMHGGNINTKQYIKWLIEIGIDPAIFEDENNKVIGKDFGFFMNSYDPLGTKITLKVLRYMLKNDIWFSMDMDQDVLMNITKTDDPDLTYDTIWIPEDTFQSVAEIEEKIIFVGGERFSCLKEIELLAILLKKKYVLNEDFIYGGDNLTCSLKEACKW